MDYIIILAGGKGLRMGTDIPKQFLPIGGLPVLMHTVKRFREYSKELNIILVLPKQQQEYWQALCDEYQFMEDYTIADGGETRFRTTVPVGGGDTQLLRDSPQNGFRHSRHPCGRNDTTFGGDRAAG